MSSFGGAYKMREISKERNARNVATVRNVASVVLAVVLVVSLLPLNALAAGASSSDASEQTNWRDNIDQMLESCEYREGEAVTVVADGGEAELSSINEDGQAASEDVLSGSESLFEASESAAALTFGESEVETAVAAADAAADEAAAATADNEADAASDDDSAVRIVAVKRDDMSTRELLEALAEDPRVICAEPNYVSYVDASDGSAATDDAHASQAESAIVEVLTGIAGLSGTTRSDAVANKAASESDTASAASSAGVDASAALATGEASTAVDESAEAFKPGDSTVASLEQIGDITSYQWANSGASCTTVMTGTRLAGFSANVPDWNTSSTNAAGVVAIVDTGIDYTHPDLEGVMYDMTSHMDKVGGGKYGYNSTSDYSRDKTKPMDGYGHGTHVAGIIAAQWNGQGTSGAANGVKLLACKTGTNVTGACGYTEAIECYEYLSRAIDDGVDVRAVNNSWGADMSYGAFTLAINALGEKGAVSVFASGNSSQDIDVNVFTSTSISSSPYAVIVNSTGQSSRVSTFSNYGVKATDLFSPGSMIMSTYCTSKSMYIPSMVQDIGANAVYDTFDGNGGIEAYLGYGTEAIKDENKLTASPDSSYHYDESGALVVTGAQLKNAEYTYALTFKIPVTRGNLSKVSMLGFSTTSEGAPYSGVVPSIEVVGSDGEAYMLRDTDFSVRSNNDLGWYNASCQLDKFFLWAKEPRDTSLVWHPDDADTASDAATASDDDTGYIVVSLELAVLSEEEIPADTDKLYIDCVGLGNSKVPYTIMSGTSMAAPLATASAAICSATVDQGKAPSERALQTAQLLKSCTSSSNGQYAGKCTSGGTLDLSKLANRSEANPVISSAQVREGEKGGQNYIDIEGICFGDRQGTVTVGGYAAEVVSWSAESIRVKAPDQLTSGERTVEVRTAEGSSCCETFVLSFSQNAPSGDVALFEETISLETSGFAGNSIGVRMIGLDGSIYVIPQSWDFPETVPYQQNISEMYRYDIESDTWTRVGNLPSYRDAKGKEHDGYYGTVSLALWEGKILMLARTGGDDDMVVQVLLSFDPSTGEWTQLDDLAANIPVGASLVNVDGTMMAIGGSDLAPGDQGTTQDTSKTSNNVAVLDMSTGELTAVGSLSVPRSNYKFTSGPMMQVAADGDTIYVGEGVKLVAGSTEGDSLPVERLTRQADGTYKSELLDSGLPATSMRYDYSYGLAAGSNGAVVTGLKVAEGDEDTFVVGDSGSSFSPFGKRPSYTALLDVTALAYHGKLYVIGEDEFNGASLVMRATAFETAEHPAGELAPSPEPGPDPSPEPTPSPTPTSDTTGGSGSATSSTLPRTGDSAPIALLVALGIAGAAAVATALLVRRRGRRS